MINANAYVFLSVLSLGIFGLGCWRKLPASVVIVVSLALAGIVTGYYAGLI